MNANVPRERREAPVRPRPLRLVAPVVAALALVLAAPGSAQDAAPGAAESAAPEMPVPDCEEPAVPEQFRSQKAQEFFVVLARVYETCMQAFIDDQARMSKLHAEAGNAAAAQFNRFAAAAAEIRPAQ